ncbi:MAG: helix-turn-helix domain-containing protein [Eubacterium ramulus]
MYQTENRKFCSKKHLVCCRFLYNQMLNDKIREYEASKKMLREIHRRCIKKHIHF